VPVVISPQAGRHAQSRPLGRDPAADQKAMRSQKIGLDAILLRVSTILSVSRVRVVEIW
jgi:hypothetical protein